MTMKATALSARPVVHRPDRAFRDGKERNRTRTAGGIPASRTARDMGIMSKIKGNRCNETVFIRREDRDKIVYRFLSDDQNTPSCSTIKIGDIDPATGKAITNVSIFREYHRIVDRQIHKNLEAVRTPYSKEQKAQRAKIKKEFIRKFEEEHGYIPTEDDFLYYWDQIGPERYNLYIGQITGRDGEPLDEFGKEFMKSDRDPFGADLPDDIYALREIADSLTGRLRAVYEAMLQHAAGGAGRITFTEVAREWHVSYNQVMKDSKKIEKMIREKIGALH